jgi:hypothetical protein
MRLAGSGHRPNYAIFLTIEIGPVESAEKYGICMLAPGAAATAATEPIRDGR